MGGPMHYLRVGQCLVSLGRFDEGIKIFGEVWKKIPKQLAVYKNFIRAYSLKKEPEKALFWAQKGVESFSVRSVEWQALQMEIAVLSSRNGWRDLEDKSLSALLESSREPGWYQDAAAFLKGRMSAEDYRAKVAAKYPYQIEDAEEIVRVKHE